MSESSVAVDRQELVNKIYFHILRVANGILHNAKHFSIEVLKLEDPTYEEIAEQLGEVCGIMESIASDFEDDYTISKAREYTINIRSIALAITDGDEDQLAKHVAELDRRPFS